MPSSHVLSEEVLNIDEDPFSSGGFSEVYKGTYKGTYYYLRVCVKKLRDALDGDPEQATKGDTLVTIPNRAPLLMALTDTLPGSFVVEALDPPQHRPIRRRDFRSPPNRVRVYVPWKLDSLHQIEPTERSRPSREPFFVPLRYLASTCISWSTSQRASITSTPTA